MINSFFPVTDIWIELLSSWQRRAHSRDAATDPMSACGATALAAAACYRVVELLPPLYFSSVPSCLQPCTTRCASAQIFLFPLNRSRSHLASPSRSTLCSPLSFRLQDDGVKYIESIKTCIAWHKTLPSVKPNPPSIPVLAVNIFSWLQASANLAGVAIKCPPRCLHSP